MQLSDIKYMHIVVQPSPPSISGNYWSSQIETMYPLNTNSATLLPPAAGVHYSTFCLYDFAYSRYFMYVESHTISPFVTGLFQFM